MTALVFTVEKHHDGDDIYFVVSSNDIALTTEGDTLEDVLKNLREAVELYYEDDNLEELPQIEVRINVTQAYA